MMLTNSETSRAVMSLARLEARAACRRGVECACRLLPPPCPRRQWGWFSRVPTGLARDPWQPFTFPGSFRILTFSFFEGTFFPGDLGGCDAVDFKDGTSFPEVPKACYGLLVFILLNSPPKPTQ